MNVLDENIYASQRELLARWRVVVRQVGHVTDFSGGAIVHDLNFVGGQSDKQIDQLMYTLRRPTFFTRDTDFDQRRLRPGYCHVCLSVKPNETAEYIRHVLRHPELNTQAKRMGTIIEVSLSGLTVWRINEAEPVQLSWPTKRRR